MIIHELRLYTVILLIVISTVSLFAQSSIVFYDTFGKQKQAYAGEDQIICSNQTNLAASIPVEGVGTWIVATGSATFQNVNDPFTLVYNLASGENLLVWRVVVSETNYSSDTVAILNNTPSQSFAGWDQVVCIDYVELIPNEPIIGEGFWSVYFGEGILNGNMVTNLSPNLNSFIYWIVNGECVSTDTVYIINNKPTTPYAGEDVITCKDTIELSANQINQGIGTWEVVSGSANFIDIHSPTTLATNLLQGNNVFKWLASKEECFEQDEVMVTKIVVTSFAGQDMITCDDYIQLNAEIPPFGNGEWSVVSGNATIEDTFNPNTLVSSLSSAINTFRWTVTYDDCVVISDVNIICNKPTPSNAGEDQWICSHETTMSANNPLNGTGSWSVLGGSASIVDINNPSTVVTGLAFGTSTLRWTITVGNCLVWDDVEIINNLPEIVNAGSDKVVCVDTVTMTAYQPLSGFGQWSLVSGQGVIEDVSSPNTVIRGLERGENIFAWTVFLGDCQSSDTVIVTNASPSQSIAGIDQSLCSDSTSLEANNPVFGVGRWELVSGSAFIVDPYSPTSALVNIGRGQNSLIWIVDSEGCQSQSQVNISNNLPGQPFAGNDIEVCCDSATLFANPPIFGTGYWEIIAGQGEIENPYSHHSLVTNLAFGTNVFRWNVYNTQCTLSDEVNVSYVDPPVPVISQVGYTLFSSAPSGNQWYNLDGIIPDATGQEYLVTITGSYYVVVYQMGCFSEPSNIISVTVTSIDLISSSIPVIYPNPTSNELTISITNNGIVGFRIINMKGETVYKGDVLGRIHIPTFQLSKGMYIISFDEEYGYNPQIFIKK